MWQQMLWHQLDALRGHSMHSEGDILGVQSVAGILTGCTSAVLTNPLDVVKTRLQTAGALGSAVPAAAVAQQAEPAVAAAGAAGGSAFSAVHGTVAGGAQQTQQPARHTWRGVAAQLAAQEGMGGFFRGVAPRMASSAIWGTGARERGVQKPAGPSQHRADCGLMPAVQEHQERLVSLRLSLHRAGQPPCTRH